MVGGPARPAHKGLKHLPSTPASYGDPASSPTGSGEPSAEDMLEYGAGGSGSKQQQRQEQLRIASWNVRVDHTDDFGTIHEWSQRRALVASSILALSADIIAIQEASPTQAADIEAELGPEWGVAITACDPDAWANEPGYGPADGQAREGNGILWRKSRVDLLDSTTLWLTPEPEGPWRRATPAWPDSSPYQRTCTVSQLFDSLTGQRVGVLSAHFDDTGDDSIANGGSQARRQAAALVMARAQDLISGKQVDLSVVCGVMNTFEDREGAAYSALYTAADGQLVDVRDVPGIREVDVGRGHASWEGWETNEWRREAAGDQRYDQMFISAGIDVRRTSVVEERYVTEWQGEYHWVYASDHLPLYADLLLPVTKAARPNKRKKKVAPLNIAPADKSRLKNCHLIMLAICLALLALVIYLLIDTFSYSYECRPMQCRNRLTDPPFNPKPLNCTASLESLRESLIAERGSGWSDAGSG